MLLKSHPPLGERRLQIYLSPALIPALTSYQSLLSTFPSAIQNLAQQQSLFWESQRFPKVKPWPIAGEALDIDPQPCIFFVSEDEDWTSYLPPLPGWEVWFPRVTEGEVEPLKPWMMADFQHRLPPQSHLAWADLQSLLQCGRGRMQTYLFADHCDGLATTQLIHNVRPQHVLFMGSCNERLAALAALEELNSRYHIHLPALGQTTEFLVGDTFFQPSTPDRPHQGELQENSSGAWLPFPPSLTQDPRWQRLADTGIVEMRWQGDELILRGISGRELMHQDLTQRQPTTQERPTCSTCRYYRGQRCWNPASALKQLKVSPEGFCPHHAAAPDA
jgi:hypothetical protein